MLVDMKEHSNGALNWPVSVKVILNTLPLTMLNRNASLLTFHNTSELILLLTYKFKQQAVHLQNHKMSFHYLNAIVIGPQL